MLMSEFGLVQVYWGNGKGKTTAALGLALRSLGRGAKVHLVQFMKCGLKNNNEFENYGELNSLKKFENFSLERFGFEEWVLSEPTKEHIEEAEKAVKHSLDAVSGKFDLVILDEILYAVQLKLISEKSVIEIIEKKAKETELVLTGSHKPFENIIEKSDLVTEMRKIKHPYDKGIKARKGIEF